MTPETTEIIFGPPGTGKTTDCMRIISEKIAEGIRPEEICFVSFTRKAATEARDRVMSKLNLKPEQIPWFRTLHSMAFIRLGLNKNQIMGRNDYISLAASLGLYVTFRGLEDDGTVSGLSKGDRLFFMENMARTKDIPLKDYWEEQHTEDINWFELERVHHTLLKYKESTDRRDFTDVIHAFNKDPRVPECRILIVDEAQDLSPIQWKMVRIIGSYAEHTFIAGDDDQAIYRWAGAESRILIELEGTRRVLPQSYRVPAPIQHLASRVVNRIDRRVPKSWLPREDSSEASVEFIGGLDGIDLSKGTWMLLARNTYLLEYYTEHCLREGLVFTSTTGSPISGEALRVIRIWESLRRGNRETAESCKRLYQYLSPKVGVSYGSKAVLERVDDSTTLAIGDLRMTYGLLTNDIWHVALDKLRPEEVTYFLTALKSGEKLNKEPRIRISTIHSVKGGEADNVVIQLDMAARTYAEYEICPDDEHRVWYVAITRARNKLFVISPKSNRCYDL